jgi:hypothetical protein
MYGNKDISAHNGDGSFFLQNKASLSGDFMSLFSTYPDFGKRRRVSSS